VPSFGHEYGQLGIYGLEEIGVKVYDLEILKDLYLSNYEADLVVTSI
jgi:hypothetical protein